jgi:hypothetical protein
MNVHDLKAIGGQPLSKRDERFVIVAPAMQNNDGIAHINLCISMFFALKPRSSGFQLFKPVIVFSNKAVCVNFFWKLKQMFWTTRRIREHGPNLSKIFLIIKLGSQVFKKFRP